MGGGGSAVTAFPSIMHQIFAAFSPHPASPNEI